MGTTPRGYRYMEPTDPLATVDDKIKNLALDVDAKLRRFERGSITLNIAATGTPVTQVINFNAAFVLPPTMAITLFNPASNAPQNFSWACASVTETQFTIIGVRVGGAAPTMSLYWLATA